MIFINVDENYVNIGTVLIYWRVQNRLVGGKTKCVCIAFHLSD